MRAPDFALARSFDAVDRVVADDLRFKRRLNIGEDAYASLKLKKRLQEFWDVGGMSMTAAAAAASPTVASTFFASTASGGVLSLVGLGTAAATPVGWIAAAGLVSGGAYYGVTRLFGRYSGSRVDMIPKFINTPIDLLGASLLDLIGGLAVRVAHIDGHFDDTEREAIKQHFIAEWGFDTAYVDRSLAVLASETNENRVKDLARATAAFQAGNPDCNAAAMQAELMAFLREVAEADGVLDEREELALDAIAAVFREEASLSLRKLGERASGLSQMAGSAARSVMGKVMPRRAVKFEGDGI
jgi:tellurite resistance protein